MRTTTSIAAGLLISGATWLSTASEAHLPPTLEPQARVAIAALGESSGIIASRRHAGVFWSHNDSGDGARLFAFRRDGSAVHPAATTPYEGLQITDATNRDWEDIATDDAGNLFVADTGNNAQGRRDLAVYMVPEPDPALATSAPATRRIGYVFPDQSSFPAEAGNRNFDAESLFWSEGTLWLLSKNYDNTRTRLYRFPSLEAHEGHVLELVGEFDIGGMATGADVSPDGRRLAVAGFRSATIDGQRRILGFVWVFERDAAGGYFTGRKWHRQFQAGQIEAICWDGDDLVLTNEPGNIFIIPFASLPAVH
jgi:hypothetical protein